MREEIKYYRRRFWHSAAMTIAAAKLVMISSAETKYDDANQSTRIKLGTNVFSSLEEIDVRNGAKPAPGIAEAK